MNYTAIDMKSNPGQDGPVEINHLSGAHDEPESRIYSFKQAKMTQPQDKGYDR